MQTGTVVHLRFFHSRGLVPQHIHLGVVPPDVILPRFRGVQGGELEYLPALVHVHHAPVKELGHRLQLVRHGHMLEAVDREINLLSPGHLCRGVGHVGVYQPRRNGEGLHLALVVGRPLVWGVFVLQDGIRHSEVVKDRLPDLGTLLFVHDVGLAVNLLDVGILGVEDHHAAGVVRRQVVLHQPVPLGLHGLRLQHVGQAGQEAHRARRLYPVDNALCLRIDQLHGRPQRPSIALPEKIIPVLELGHDAHLIQLHCSCAPGGKAESYVLASGALQNFRLGRQDRIKPGQA